MSTLCEAAVKAEPSALHVVEEGTADEKGGEENWPFFFRVSGAIVPLATPEISLWWRIPHHICVLSGRGPYVRH